MKLGYIVQISLLWFDCLSFGSHQAKRSQGVSDEMNSDEEPDVLYNSNDHNGGEEARNQHASHNDDPLHDSHDCHGDEKKSQHASFLEETVMTLRTEMTKMQQ